VTDADGATPTPGVVVLALTDTSGVPYPAMGTSDATGDYHLPIAQRPLQTAGFDRHHWRAGAPVRILNGRKAVQRCAVMELNDAGLRMSTYSGSRRTIQGFIDLAGAGPRFQPAPTPCGIPVLIYNSTDGGLATMISSV
jgi:hypothetical protein